MKDTIIARYAKHILEFSRESIIADLVDC